MSCTAPTAAAPPTSSATTFYRAAAAGLPTLADPGYEGAGTGILIPVRQPAGGRELEAARRRERDRRPCLGGSRRAYHGTRPGVPGLHARSSRRGLRAR